MRGLIFFEILSAFLSFSQETYEKINFFKIWVAILNLSQETSEKNINPSQK